MSQVEIEQQNALASQPQLAKQHHQRGVLAHLRILHDNRNTASYPCSPFALSAADKARYGERLIVAIHHYSAALKANPCSVESHYNRGLAHLYCDWPQAHADLSRAIELCPALAPAYFLRGFLTTVAAITGSGLPELPPTVQAAVAADFATAIDLVPGWAEVEPARLEATLPLAPLLQIEGA
jgi:hypothetical protein